ncbi:hypothetical protein CIB48_g12021 [Xylaria polymorpha]|nr:hypothetical protein CIB48_g12021 [Xylaria polymorpha]
MPIPFICRKCTARLAGSTFSLFRPNRPRLYSTAIPAEQPTYAVVLPARYDHVQQPESSQPKHVIEALEAHGGNHSAISLASSTPQQGQNEWASETATTEDGDFRTFVPKRRAEVDQLAGLSPGHDARELKAKILGARGDYKIVDRDLEVFYALSPSEARHAVGQLERLLWGRSDMLSAAVRLDQYHAWKKNYSAVLRNSDAASSVGANNPSTGLARAGTAFHQSKTASMKTAWQGLDRGMRQRLWPAMVLFALESELHTLPILIQSTFDPSWCPSYVVEDVLYFLFRRHQQELQNNAQGDCGQTQQAIEAIASFVLHNCPPRYLVLEQTVLHFILSPLPTSELAPFHQLLLAIEHPLHSNTLLHLASRFAKGPDTKMYAVDILRVLTGRPGFDLNTPAAASVCTSLLALKESEPLPDEHAAPDILFEFLLKQGFRPNLLQLSALVRNFCIRGHTDTAWKIFELMFQLGLEPDQHVYSILLNASKQNHDMVSLERIFNIITSRNAWSTTLMNDFLDLIFRENEWQPERRRRQRKTGNNAWRPMFQLYAKFFDLAPLQKFALFSLENLVGTYGVPLKHQTTATRLAESLMPQPDNKLMQPDSTTLCLMIGAYLRSILTPKYANRYYNFFFGLVNRKDPAALGLLAGQRTLVVDHFLRTLMQFKQTTALAVRRLRKMINAAIKEKMEDGHNLHHHPPTIHTWTIMLNGLKNHGDMRGVVALLDMMTNVSRIKPTLPTWNAVIQGFARTRNVSGGVKAVRSLEKAGFQPNDQTLKALRMFPRPLLDQVLAQLEMMRKAPEKFQTPNTFRRVSCETRVAPKPNETHGFSSNMPIHFMRPVISKALNELAQHRDQLSPKDFKIRRVKPRVTKQSRVPKKLNSYLPYLGL